MWIIAFFLFFLPGLLISEEDEFSSQWEATASELKRVKEGLKADMDKWEALLKTDSSKIIKNPEYLLTQIRLEFYKQTEPYSSIPIIKPWELQQHWGDSNLILVDVRQPEEQLVSTLQGALTTQALSSKYKRKDMLAGKKILTFDTIGYRSAVFASQLQKMGLTVSVLEGGLLAWTHVKGPLVEISPDSTLTPTQSLHIYDPLLNWVHPDYIPVW